FLLQRKEADIYKISENQIRINVTKCALVNSSSYKKTPMNSMIVGAIYCKNPSIDNDVCNTALPNKSKGTAVAMPENKRSKLSFIAADVKPIVVIGMLINMIRVIGVIIIVAIARLNEASILASFFSNPYKANVTACTRDIHGKMP